MLCAVCGKERLETVLKPVDPGSGEFKDRPVCKSCLDIACDRAGQRGWEVKTQLFQYEIAVREELDKMGA